jgi:hypothetical protein
LGDRDDAVAAGANCFQWARRVGATSEPEIFFERVTRNGAFDLAAAKRQRENRGACVPFSTASVQHATLARRVGLTLFGHPGCIISTRY